MGYTVMGSGHTNILEFNGMCPICNLFRGYIVVFSIKISDIKYFATAKILMLFAISLFLAPKNEK